MSVPETKRRTGKLEVLVKVLEVTKYTNLKLSNQKKCDPKFDYVLGDDIKKTSRDIYRHCWGANSIRVTDKSTRDARKKLQQQAVQDCNELLMLIDMAQATYHFSSKSVEYWGRITIVARDSIRKWRDADNKRYKHYDDS